MEPIQVASQLLGNLEAAWNQADGAAYGVPFADDAEFVDIRGTLHRGKATIAAGHQAIFDSIYKGSRISYQATDARAISPDIVVCHGVATMQAPGEAPHGRRIVSTLVAVRQGGAWRIAAQHNAIPDGDAPPAR